MLLSAKRYLKGSSSCFDLSHSATFPAMKLPLISKPIAISTQPAAAQQCSYSQPSDSKLLLSFLTTPCALSHLRNDPAGNFTTNYSQSPREKKTPYSLHAAPAVTMLNKHTFILYTHSKLQ